MLATSFSANWRWSLLATTYWILAQHLRCVSPLADVCSQQSPNGSCGKSETRYYYDVHTRVCRTFHWRGCLSISGFDGNIFENAQECVEACNGTVVESDESSPGYTIPTPRSAPPGVIPPIETLPPDPTIPTGDPDNDFNLDHCLLPLDPGQPYPGFSPFPLFFFNSSSRQCEQFFLLGVGGNFNNFYNLEECLAKCGSLIDSFLEDTGSADMPSTDTSNEDKTTTTPSTHITSIPITNLPPISPPPTERPSVIHVPTEEPDVTQSDGGTAATTPASLSLPSELPSPEDGNVVVTTQQGTSAETTTENFTTETNDVTTTEQVVAVEGDKGSLFFLYATVAVTLVVAMISLVAVGVVILMMYRYQVTKRMDAKFVSRQEQVRKSLPSTSTCSSSVSV